MITAICIGIAIFMGLVIIHELGHFWTARKFGVKVQEFGVGIPPKVTTVATDKQQTAYTLNWIPLGGFVRLKGEDPSNTEEFLAPDSFISAPLYGKLIILIGGITANILFAWIAFSVAFRYGVKPLSILPDTSTAFESTSYLVPSYSFLERIGKITPRVGTGDEQVIVQSVLTESRASSAGIEQGDMLLTIDGLPVTIENFSDLIKNNYGKSFTLSYIRDNNTFEKQITCGQAECLLGVGLGQDIPGLADITISFGFFEARRAGLHEIGAQTRMSFAALGNIAAGLFSFNKEKVASSTKSLSGPVGIIKTIQVLVLRGSFTQLLVFAGMISLALAIFNILPIPALDGGRALSVLIQTIGGRKPTKYFAIEGRLNMFFFILLMLLGILIIIKDLKTAWGIDMPFS